MHKCISSKCISSRQCVISNEITSIAIENNLETMSSSAEPQMISTTTEKSAAATTTTDSSYYEIYYSGSGDAYDVDSKLHRQLT